MTDRESPEWDCMPSFDGGVELQRRGDPEGPVCTIVRSGVSWFWAVVHCTPEGQLNPRGVNGGETLTLKAAVAAVEQEVGA